MKRSKASVDYSQGGDHCGACTHFIDEDEKGETGRCELVDGSIREDMWCKLFKRESAGYRTLERNVKMAARHVRKK